MPFADKDFVRRRSTPKLPGAPRSRRPLVNVEPSISIDTAKLARDLLSALRNGPLMKWELRARLHVDEGIIFRELKKLKAAGHVKVIGKVLQTRAWALTTWSPSASSPTPTYAKDFPIASRKPKAPTDSWWARPQMTREQFSQAQTARERELGRDGSGQVVRR